MYRGTFVGSRAVWVEEDKTSEKRRIKYNYSIRRF
jgi:hypothetical protein